MEIHGHPLSKRRQHIKKKYKKNKQKNIKKTNKKKKLTETQGGFMEHIVKIKRTNNGV